MSNTDLIIELLESIQPEKYCDDCLSNELNISPRQQVNQICNRLESQRRLIRANGSCLSCHKKKIVNSIVSEGFSKSIHEINEEKLISYNEEVRIEPVLPPVFTEHSINIQKIRREVVQICLNLWSKTHREKPPKSVSATINQLKSENKIPYHQSNMMLTICGLRNCYEYGYLELGERENAIAIYAWEIVQEWWEGKNQE